MADFRPLLQRAIAGLPENTPEARKAIYSRARDALERHVATREPALDEAERLSEILALEDVIRSLEGEALKPALPQAPELSMALPEKPAPDIKGTAFDDPQAQEAPIVLKMPERLKLPEKQSDAPRRKRLGLLAGFGILAILTMAGLALTYRAGPEHYRKVAAPPQRPIADPVDQNKREGRLSTAENTAPSNSALSNSALSNSALSNSAPARPATPAAPAPSSQPSIPAQPQAAGPAVPSQPPLLVSSRAFMILEGQGTAPDQFEGQASWSFVADPANRNGPKLVRFDVQFAAAGLKLDGSIILNTDPAIDASHTILLIFEPGERNAAIREMSAIEWRERETVNGSTLSGRLAPIQDNVFMIGLDANAAARQRNLDLLRTQRWLVFETRMANGRRGAFLIEKGSSGEKAISEALSEWK